MSKFTIEEANVLTSFGYEMEDDEYVLCYPKGELTPSQEEVISTLVNKEVLSKDGLDEKYFWIRQNDYREVCDLVEGFAKGEAKDEAEKPTKVAWQDLMLQEFKDLITVEGLSMDAARDEMMVRTSRFLDVALFHFLELITNSKLSDF